MSLPAQLHCRVVVALVAVLLREGRLPRLQFTNSCKQDNHKDDYFGTLDD